MGEDSGTALWTESGQLQPTNGHSSHPIHRGRCFRNSFLQIGRRRSFHIHCLDDSDRSVDGGHCDRQVRRRTESPADHAFGGSSDSDIPQRFVGSGGTGGEGIRIGRADRACWPPSPDDQVEPAEGSVHPLL